MLVLPSVTWNSTCEFTRSENGFITWVESDIGSLESKAANIEVEEITTPYTIAQSQTLF